jgi:UDP-glucose 4-epimerase
LKDSSNKKIVVTGATGFIGSRIVHTLEKAGYEVVVARVDILDTKALQELFTGAWAVVHQAGLPPIPLSVKDPLASHKVNVTGSLSVFVAARDVGVDRVIYASSTTVYGKNPILPKVESLALEPCSPYSLQKAEVEMTAKLFYELYGLKTIGLRYSNVYGESQDLTASYVPVVAKFISLLKEGKSPQIFGDGKQLRDFIFVDDIADANLLALQSEKGFGEVYNIAYGSSISLITLVEKLNTLMGTSIQPDFFPMRAGDNPDSVIDISKATQDFGYSPKVSFEEGLKRTIDSM